DLVRVHDPAPVRGTDEVDQAARASAIDRSVVDLRVVVPDRVAELLVDAIDGAAVAVEQLRDLLLAEQLTDFARRYLGFGDHRAIPRAPASGWSPGKATRNPARLSIFVTYRTRHEHASRSADPTSRPRRPRADRLLLRLYRAARARTADASRGGVRPGDPHEH